MHPIESPTLTRDLILQVLRTRRPATVGVLAQIMRIEHGLDEEELAEMIRAMAKDGSVVLRKPTHVLESMLDYLISPTLSSWFWLVLGLTALVNILVFVGSELFPLNAIRVILGSIFVLYLPGYSMVQFLFPEEGDLDRIERFAYNVALSVALVPLIGLFLNFLPAGLDLTPVVLSLSGFTVIFAIAAVVRKYLIIQDLAATARAERFS